MNDQDNRNSNIINHNSQSQSDLVGRSRAKSDQPRPRDWLTLDQVEQQFAAAGLIRTRTLLARYCRQQRLKGIKDAGPNGDEWYVDPSSVPRAIAELKRINRDEPSPTEADAVGPSQTQSDINSVGDRTVPIENHAPSSTLTDPDPVEPSQTESDGEEPSPTDLSDDQWSTADLKVYSHPYVKKLEAQNEQLHDDLKQQHMLTHKIQRAHARDLVDLNRMKEIAHSPTLADVVRVTGRWLTGRKDKPDEDENSNIDDIEDILDIDDRKSDDTSR